MPVIPKIVISYRRSDSIEISGRIYDWLKAHYGDDAVFMDVASNRPGYDYRREIKEAMQNCRAVIAVIGSKWTGGSKGGHTRITDADDPVRSELENAFRLEKPIIPVLVSGARMPAPGKLPESLRDLTYIHAAEVDAAQDFDFHIERLIREIDRRLNETPSAEMPRPSAIVSAPEYLPVVDRATAAAGQHELPLPSDALGETAASAKPANRGGRKKILAVAVSATAVACALGAAVWVAGWPIASQPAKSSTAVVASVESKEAAPPAPAVKVEPKVIVAPPPIVKAERKDIGGLYDALTISPQLSDTKPLRALAFSPDRRILAVAGDDGVIRLWDANTFQMIKTLAVPRSAPAVSRKPVRRIEFTPDGSKLVAAGFENAIRIWNVATGDLQQTLSDSQDGFDLQFYSLAVYPRGELRWIMAGAADGRIRIWDLQKDLSKPVVRKPAHAGEVYALRYSPAISDDYASAGRDGMIKFYTSAPEPTPSIPTKERAIFYLQYYPAGDKIISAGTDRTVKVWRIGDPNPIRSFEKDGHSKSVLTADLSPNGGLLLSGGDDHLVKLWDAETTKLIHTFIGHKEDVEAVAFHPNRKWFVSISEDGMLKLWDIASKKELLSIVIFEDDHYIAFTPAGRYTGDVNDSRHVRITYRDGAVERNLSDDLRKQLFIEPGRFASVVGLN